MALIAAWTNFLLANVRVHAKRLREGFAQESSNQRLGFGDLRGILAPTNVHNKGGPASAVPAVATIYRMNKAVVSDTTDWIWWDFSDVDIVRSPVAIDNDEEIFYTGDPGVSGPRRTNRTLALPAAPGPAASRPMGVPQTTDPISAALLVAGSGPSEERFYVDTFYDPTNLREGAPNTTTTNITVAGGSTVTLGSFGAVPAGYSDVTQRRIYVSTSGTEFLLCVEGLASAGTLVDALARTTVLQSGGDNSKPAWLEPQTEMLGLIALWNGMVGGFRGKELCLCEPYKLWAWPAEYRIKLHDEIVGTGTWGQNWVVITNAGPYIVTGTHPANMNPVRLPFDLSCTHKRAVVSMDNGVAWISANGICYMGDGFPPALITETIIAPEVWRSTYQQFVTVGARFEDHCLFALRGSSSDIVFMINPRADTGFTLRTYSGFTGPIGAFYDQLSDRLYVATYSSATRFIDRWGAGAQSTVVHRTKTIRYSRPVNPGFMLVVADTASVQVELYGDGVLRHTFSAVTPDKPMGLPGGYKSRDFDVRITSSGNVQGVLLAEDAADLV